jgi:hypothetical protein
MSIDFDDPTALAEQSRQTRLARPLWFRPIASYDRSADGDRREGKMTASDEPARRFGARSAIIVGAAVLLALFATWYFISPRWTLHEMKAAAQAGDTDTLATYIDFPAVRTALKEELQASAARQVANDSGPFEKLGAMLAMSMIDKMVDGFVTPAGMRQLFSKVKQEGQGPRGGVDAAKDNLAIERISFDRFRLYDPTAKDGGAFIFERHGLGWKLAEVRVPM